MDPFTMTATADLASRPGFNWPAWWAELDAIQATPTGERVATGTALLDREVPGWWRTDREYSVDVARLDLFDPVNCVVGQLFDGRYETALRLLGLADCRDDVRHGFATGALGEYPTLTRLWCEAITARRNAG